jgi:triphosphatase
MTMSRRRKASREIELKLELDDPDQLARLLDQPALARPVDACRDQRLHAVYFDTPDQALRAKGLSLRVRESDGRWIQTLKAADRSRGVALDRAEWEVPVEGRWPDFAILRSTPLKPLLPQRDQIRPAFEVHVRRNSRVVREGASLVEVSADLGEIRAGDRAEPLCEVELEMKDGRAGDVFTLAARLVGAVPLHLSALTKSERGYEALADTPARRVKAEAVRFPADASAAEAFQAIARSCLAHLLANDRIVRRAPDPDAVHQMRVALRRLRAAITLFKEVARDTEVDAVKTELRWITNALGSARDLDVYLDTILLPEQERSEHNPDLDRIVAEVRAKRDEAYAALATALRSPRYTRALLDTAGWIEAGPWLSAGKDAPPAQPAIDLARAQLKRRWRSVRRSLKHVRAMSPEERHEVRIAIKKLRYGSEFFSTLFRKQDVKRHERKALQAFEALQEALGKLNDIAVAAERHGVPDEASQAERERIVDDLLALVEKEAQSFAALEPYWKA